MNIVIADKRDVKASIGEALFNYNVYGVSYKVHCATHNI
jgi:hypothetical protein